MELTLLFLFSIFIYAQSIGPHLKKEGENHKVDRLNFANWNSPTSQNESECLTQGCVKAAAAIINSMNETADPCKDFYQFACGGWIKNQIIPVDELEVSVFSLLKKDIDQKLRSIVENDIKKTDPQYIQNVKYMYETCMNTTHIEKQGLIPIKRALKELGGWPVVEGSKWNERTFNWMQSIFSLRKRGFDFNIFFSLSVDPDDRNQTRNIIHLDKPRLGKSLLKGLEDEDVAAYYKLMVDQAVLLGAKNTTAQKELKETLKFEIQLANISVFGEETKNKSRKHNYITIDNLRNLAPGTNWNAYMENLLLNSIGRNEEIMLEHPIYPIFFQRLEKLLNSTKKRVVANYVMWCFVRDAHSMLGQEYSVQRKDRWTECLRTLSNTLHTALSSLYVKKHFQKESKLQALEMSNYIRKEFLKIVEAAKWIDNETRRSAKEKIHSMSTYIGYPNELLNRKDMENMYKGLLLHPYDYFENVKKISKWSTDDNFAKLRKPNVRGDFFSWIKNQETQMTKVNAIYAPTRNSITIPAAILQGAIFDRDRPKYLNFGAIGFIIGHEITHGFDNKGRQYDKDGNFVDWWTDDADKNFVNKTKCIIDQYGNYTFKEVGLQVNGTNTQGENIADNGGIKEAYRAYKEWTRDYGQEKKLPGLKYTPTQLFWISTANFGCQKYSKDGIKASLLKGVHTPWPFRINGLLHNSLEFSKEFGCAVGTPMNPKKKCSVW